MQYGEQTSFQQAAASLCIKYGHIFTVTAKVRDENGGPLVYTAHCGECNGFRTYPAWRICTNCHEVKELGSHHKYVCSCEGGNGPNL